MTVPDVRAHDGRWYGLPETPRPDRQDVDVKRSQGVRIEQALDAPRVNPEELRQRWEQGRAVTEAVLEWLEEERGHASRALRAAAREAEEKRERAVRAGEEDRTEAGQSAEEAPEQASEEAELPLDRSGLREALAALALEPLLDPGERRVAGPGVWTHDLRETMPGAEVQPTNSLGAASSGEHSTGSQERPMPEALATAHRPRPERVVSLLLAGRTTEAAPLPSRTSAEETPRQEEVPLSPLPD